MKIANSFNFFAHWFPTQPSVEQRLAAFAARVHQRSHCYDAWQDALDEGAPDALCERLHDRYDAAAHDVIDGRIGLANISTQACAGRHTAVQQLRGDIKSLEVAHIARLRGDAVFAQAEVKIARHLVHMARTAKAPDCLEISCRVAEHAAKVDTAQCAEVAYRQAYLLSDSDTKRASLQPPACPYTKKPGGILKYRERDGDAAKVAKVVRWAPQVPPDAQEIPCNKTPSAGRAAGMTLTYEQQRAMLCPKSRR